jgi:hypothetical protein
MKIKVVEIENRISLMMLSAAISGTIAVFIYFVFGIYLEDNNAIGAALLYGEFGPIGNDQLITDYYFPFFYLLAKWCEAWQKWPVYGIVSFLQLLLTSFGWSYLFLSWHRVHKNIWLTIAFLFLLLVLLLDSLIYQHTIRSSLLLAFSGLLIHHQFIVVGSGNGKLTRLAFFLYLTGLIVRMHAPVLVLSLFIGFYCLSGYGVRRVLFEFRYYIFFSALFIGVYQLNGLFDENFGKYIEANYEYAILEKKSFYPLSEMKSAKDSIKYHCIQQFFITDTAEFTKEFFERVVNVNYPKQQFWHISSIQQALKQLANGWSEVGKDTFPVLLAFIVSVWFANARKKDVVNAILFFFIAHAVLFTLVLVLVDEMKIRLFSPFVAATTISLGLIILFPAEGAKRKYLGIFLLMVALAVLSIKLPKTLEMAKNLRETEEQNLSKALKLKEYNYQHPVISFVFSEIPLPSAIFFRQKNLLYPNLAYFDAGYLTYFSYTRSRFEKLFGCSPLDYQALIELFDSRNDIRYYLTEERKKLVEDYFRIVYRTELIFTPAPEQPDAELNGRMYCLTTAPKL